MNNKIKKEEKQERAKKKNNCMKDKKIEITKQLKRT